MYIFVCLWWNCWPNIQDADAHAQEVSGPQWAGEPLRENSTRNAKTEYRSMNERKALKNWNSNIHVKNKRRREILEKRVTNI